MSHRPGGLGVPVATAAVALLVVTATVPSAGVVHEPSPAEGGEETADLLADQHPRRGGTQAASPTQAAREGVERAIAALEAEGSAVPEGHRRAAIRGAELGAALATNQSSLAVLSPDDSQPTTVAPEAIRLAAQGGAVGALRAANRYPVDEATIESATTGGLLGSVSAVAAVASRGGETTDEQILAAAQGGAAGTTAAVGEITDDEEFRATSGHVVFAAAGGSSGALAAAGLFPTFGQQADPAVVSAAASGSAAGAITGTHVYAEAVPLPITPAQTFAVAAGAAGGGVSATVVNPELAAGRIEEGSGQAASETLSRTDLATPEQYSEAAITASLARLTTVSTGDGVFRQPIRLGAYLAISPRDPDGDGRYEDVNGNLIQSYDDAILLSIILSSGVELTPEQRLAFDFNGDGVLDYRDVHALDVEITGGPYAGNATQG